MNTSEINGTKFVESAKRAKKGGRSGSDQYLVSRPIGCPPEIWAALVTVREAQRHLSKYDDSSKLEKEYHAKAAEAALRESYNALAAYTNAIDLD